MAGVAYRSLSEAPWEEGMTKPLMAEERAELRACASHYVLRLLDERDQLEARLREAREIFQAVEVRGYWDVRHRIKSFLGHPRPGGEK
jgi:hypothetical protein